MALGRSFLVVQIWHRSSAIQATMFRLWRLHFELANCTPTWFELWVLLDKYHSMGFYSMRYVMRQVVVVSA